VIEATNENAGFGLVGHKRGWASEAPGRLLQTVLRTRVANPVMVVDEVEKAGTTMSQNGGQYGLAAVLLPLLKPLTAQR
jgi:ATP-dependent Lon protease